MYSLEHFEDARKKLLEDIGVAADVGGISEDLKAMARSKVTLEFNMLDVEQQREWALKAATIHAPAELQTRTGGRYLKRKTMETIQNELEEGLMPAETKVVIQNLVSKPDLNGQLCTITKFDATKGRYNVDCGAGESYNLKPECLALCAQEDDEDMGGDVADEEQRMEADAEGDGDDDGAPAGDDDGYGGMSAGGKAYRRQKVREALDKAAGTSSAKVVIDIIENVINDEEMEELRRRVLKKSSAPCAREQSWADLARSLVSVLLTTASRAFLFPMLVFSAALRMSGFASWRRVKGRFGLAPSRAAWDRSENLDPEEFRRIKYDNGRLGWRKVPQKEIREFLTSHSWESCQTLVAKPTSFLPGEEKADFVERRTITDSLHALLQKSGIKYSTTSWYRRVKAEHAHFKEGTRLLDLCEKCLDWDRRLGNLVAGELMDWAKELQELRPKSCADYWGQWNDAVVKEMSDHHVKNVSVELVQKFLDYIDAHNTWDNRESDGTSVEAKHKLQRKEADIMNQIRTKWKTFDCDMSLIDVVRASSWHFTCRDVHKTLYQQDLHAPPPGYLLIEVDFAQCSTLPIGPKEGSRQYFAGGRLSVTILGFYVWGTMVPEGRYITYLSEVMDHTTPFAIAALDHLLEALASEGISGEAGYIMWADCGRHFRSRLMWTYWIDELGIRFGTNNWLKYKIDGHGKSRLDGGFGKQRRWQHQVAKKQVVSTHKELCDGLNAVSEVVSVRRPHKFVLFDPKPRSSYLSLAYSLADLQNRNIFITSSFCISGKVLNATTVQLNDHTLANSPVQREGVFKKSKTGASKEEEDEDEMPLAKLLSPEALAPGKPGVDGWRRTYRKSEPEKTPPSLIGMRNHMRKAGALIDSVPLSCRRRAKPEVAAHWQEVRAREKAVANETRKRREEKRKAKSSSSSNGSDSESNTSSSNTSGSSS